MDKFYLKCSIFIFTIVVALPFFAFSQFKVLKNTSVTININTELRLNGQNLSLILEDSSKLVNNGIIRLDSLVSVVEPVGNPITGLGYEITQRVYNTAITNENIASLGAQITTSGVPGSITLKRAHQPFFDVSGNNSIKRSFDFDVENNNNLNATLRFFYDTIELNNLLEPALTIFLSADSGNTWQEQNSTLIEVGNYAETSNLDSLSIYTLFMQPIKIDSLSSLNLCAGDSLHISYSFPTSFNPGNIFKAELSDTTGIFNSFTYIGEEQSSSSNIIHGLIPTDIAAGNYKIRIVASDISHIGLPYEFSITIRSLPDSPDSISGPPIVCSNYPDSYFKVSGGANHTSYTWSVNPSSAGSFSLNASSDSLKMNWDSLFTGVATISVKSLNQCGESVADQSISVTVSICTGVSESVTQNRPFIYPNPSRDQFVINHQKGQEKYQIFSSLGALVKEGIINGSSDLTLINHNLSPGIYFLKLSLDTLSFVERIIIE